MDTTGDFRLDAIKHLFYYLTSLILMPHSPDILLFFSYANLISYYKLIYWNSGNAFKLSCVLVTVISFRAKSPSTWTKNESLEPPDQI